MTRRLTGGGPLCFQRLLLCLLCKLHRKTEWGWLDGSTSIWSSAITENLIPMNNNLLLYHNWADTYLYLCELASKSAAQLYGSFILWNCSFKVILLIFTMLTWISFLLQKGNCLFVFLGGGGWKGSSSFFFLNFPGMNIRE